MADRDVLIVGAGTAGCVLAARLSEDPACEVLLLEAGPDLRCGMPPEVRSGWRPAFSFDWGYASEPDPYGVIRELPRGRLVGGCSSTNATVALRGSPADYDAWAKAGNEGWSFDELLPYFVRLERDEDFGDGPWHGNGGPLPIRRYRADQLTDSRRRASRRSTGSASRGSRITTRPVRSAPVSRPSTAATGCG